jgi:hypothetical protein
MPESRNTTPIAPALFPTYSNEVIRDTGRFRDLQGRPVPAPVPTFPPESQPPEPSIPAGLPIASLLNPVQQGVTVASLLRPLGGDQPAAAQGIERLEETDGPPVQVTTRTTEEASIPTASLEASQITPMQRTMQLRDCPVCNQTLRSTYTLNEHVRLRHPDFRWPCDECDKGARTLYGLIQHKETHVGSRGRRYCSVRGCPRSDHEFESFTALKSHERKVHRGMNLGSVT